METVDVRFSFIVPFYGVEKYIGDCLESIYHQDIPEQEYEVICINDCSPDSSEEIVMQYASKHPNLRLIRHEVNKKLGAARNTGLAAARGKYVWFIDSDDYIEKDCLAEILTCCENNDLEILHFGIRTNYNEVYRCLVPTNVVTGPQEELISARQSSIEITYPWNRVYKREYLLSNNLLFNDLYGGDVIHTILAVNYANRMMNVDKFYHYYRVDNLASDTKSAMTAQKIFDMNFVLAKATRDIEHLIVPEWRYLIEECCPWRLSHSVKGILRLSVHEKVKLYELFKKNVNVLDCLIPYMDKKLLFIVKNPIVTIMLGVGYSVAKWLRDKGVVLKAKMA